MHDGNIRYRLKQNKCNKFTHNIMQCELAWIIMAPVSQISVSIQFEALKSQMKPRHDWMLFYRSYDDSSSDDTADLGPCMVASSCARMGDTNAAASRASSKASACLKNSTSSAHSRRIRAMEAALGGGRLLVPVLRVCPGCSAKPPLK